MHAKRDVYVGIGALMAIVMLVAFGAIGLFTRMSPAIERILQENDYSLDAAEDMLAIVAHTSGEASLADREAFDAAFKRSEENITEAEEKPVIESIARRAPAALAGDVAVRTALIDDLAALARINRGAMRRADNEAKRLGTAGAWTAVVLGFVGFAVGLTVIALLKRRIIDPLGELFDTAVAARRGERGRRCHVSDGPMEIVVVMKLINDLFDQRDRDQTRESRTQTDSQFADRVVLLHLLERGDAPIAMVDAQGELVTANTRAMELLESERGADYRAALRTVPSGARPPSIATADQVATAHRYLVTLSDS